MRRAVRAAKRNRNIKLSARHHEHVGRVVDHLIEGDEGKTERHKLDDRPQPDHRRANAQTGETVLANWCVDDALGTETVEQPGADLVSAVVFGHFFAHQEHVWVALQFFSQCFVERLAIRDLSHSLAAASRSRSAGGPPASTAPLKKT